MLNNPIILGNRLDYSKWSSAPVNLPANYYAGSEIIIDCSSIVTVDNLYCFSMETAPLPEKISNDASETLKQNTEVAQTYLNTMSIPDGGAYRDLSIVFAGGVPLVIKSNYFYNYSYNTDSNNINFETFFSTVQNINSLFVSLLSDEAGRLQIKIKLGFGWAGAYFVNYAKWPNKVNGYPKLSLQILL